MQVTIVGCPFRTTYGQYIESLKGSLKCSGAKVRWAASNCGCGDPIEISREFQTAELEYFEIKNEIGPFNLMGYSFRQPHRSLKEPFRAASLNYRISRYLRDAVDSDVIHFQQTLGAYGSNSAFRLLKRGAIAARVITVHELDPEQSANPGKNTAYNLSDAIVVHDVVMKEKLVSLGVSSELVHVVCWGTDITDFDDVGLRDGIVFYGGHNLNKGKGLDVLLQGLKSLKEKTKNQTPRLRIHGHFGAPSSEFLELVSRLGLDDDVEWLGDLPNEKITELYRRSQVCVLPYTGSFAGLPAGFAAANRLPVIGTRLAGIPGHLGENGIWVKGRDPEEIASSLMQLLSDAALRREYGQRLRAHAEQYLNWLAVAKITLNVYRSALERASLRNAA